jgi:hypothetical protein
MNWSGTKRHRHVVYSKNMTVLINTRFLLLHTEEGKVNKVIKEGNKWKLSCRGGKCVSLSSKILYTVKYYDQVMEYFAFISWITPFYPEKQW